MYIKSMKSALIIPVYKQRKYWDRMLSAIECQSHLPDVVYVVMDRPTRYDYNYVKNLCSVSTLKCKYVVCDESDIPEYVARPNMLPEQELFLAGDRRNRAIKYAIADGCDVFIFIDGDCIPQEDLVKSHMASNSLGVPNISVGRRREEKHLWKDQREIDPNVIAYRIFSANKTRVINSLYLLESSTIIWTCNCSMNLSAVNTISKMNRLYYGRDEVFNGEFSGTWGGEDGFLGIQAHLTNIFITTLCDDKSGIKHIEHARPEQKYSPKAFQIYMAEHVELLRLMLLNKPLELDFFT